MGTSTRMEFLNIQMNEKLEEARFTFKAPEGVTVIPAGNF
jgi:outer membrane lipoprotein-sorting protein